MEEDRQLGNPWPTGRPSRRIERRSGGKEKLKVDSMDENSRSVRPSRTGMLEALRRWIRVLAYAANEKQTNLVVVVVVVVARGFGGLVIILAAI